MAFNSAMANEYHNDKLKNTIISGIKNKAVSRLVATRGFCLPNSEGNKAILKAKTLIANTMSCQVCIGLLYQKRNYLRRGE
jgi:hypothetical protein